MLFNAVGSIRQHNRFELQKAWYQSLDQERQSRLMRYKKYWDFFLGDHWRNADEDSEGLVTLNYCKLYVMKSVAWLIGNGIEFIAMEGYDDLIPLINDVWENNKGQKKAKFLYNAGIMGSITGDVWVKVSWDTKSSPESPIRLILLDSSIVEPIFNPHDLDDIQGIVISYPFYDEESGRVINYQEEITNESILIKHDDEIILSEANPLGFINVVHAQNQPIPCEFWGLSDLADMLPINEEFNRKNTDVSDIINYHAEPITCIFGAKMKQIVQGDNKTWSGFPEKARVENLQLTGDLKASNDYIEKIKSYMHEIGEIPRGSLDTMNGISNTSGIGLHIQFLPLIELTKRKQITYGALLKDINSLIIRIAEKMGYGDVNWSKLGKRKYLCIDSVFEMPLPKDRLIEMNLIREEMSLRLESRRGAMERLKKRDISRKIAEIDKELEEDKDGWLHSLTASSGMVNNATDNQRKNIGGIVHPSETVKGSVEE